MTRCGHHQRLFVTHRKHLQTNNWTGNSMVRRRTFFFLFSFLLSFLLSFSIYIYIYIGFVLCWCFVLFFFPYSEDDQGNQRVLSECRNQLDGFSAKYRGFRNDVGKCERGLGIGIFRNKQEKKDTERWKQL